MCRQQPENRQERREEQEVHLQSLPLRARKDSTRQMNQDNHRRSNGKKYPGPLLEELVRRSKYLCYLAGMGSRAADRSASQSRKYRKQHQADAMS
jgi:hypothetical protein